MSFQRLALQRRRLLVVSLLGYLAGVQVFGGPGAFAPVIHVIALSAAVATAGLCLAATIVYTSNVVPAVQARVYGPLLTFTGYLDGQRYTFGGQIGEGAAFPLTFENDILSDGVFAYRARLVLDCPN